jgi:prepilin-type N-terminal cleavage/methylation domain-containing protein
MKRGFSLLELAMVLVIASLMLNFVLKASSVSTNADCYARTRTQLHAIREAMDRFTYRNDRLPMPAQRNVAVNNPQYGREAVVGNLTVAGASVWGALPFQALGLNSAYAGDCWGNKFTYVVTTAMTTNATSGGFPDPAVTGAITVKSSASSNFSTANYVVISHGEDELGAAALNYAGAANWCSGSTDIKYTNCLATSATAMNAPFNNGTNATLYFDDVLIAGAEKPVADECPLCPYIPLMID